MQNKLHYYLPSSRRDSWGLNCLQDSLKIYCSIFFLMTICSFALFLRIFFFVYISTSLYKNRLHHMPRLSSLYKLWSRMYVLCVYFVFFFKDAVPKPFCIYSSRNNHPICKNIYVVVHEPCHLAAIRASCCLKGKFLCFRV